MGSVVPENMESYILHKLFLYVNLYETNPYEFIWVVKHNLNNFHTSIYKMKKIF